METLKNQQIEENKIIEDTKNEYYIEHDIEYFETMRVILDDDVTLACGDSDDSGVVAEWGSLNKSTV